VSRRLVRVALVCCLLLLIVAKAEAGMAAPLPGKEALARVLRLNGTARERLQALSLFLLVLLLCALGVRFLWNSFCRDFPKLPRLSFGKALVGVLLWGFLFVLVLAMIGGARELMTPGAWRKVGFTYQLNLPPREEPDLDLERRQHLEKLRTALLQFAATHNGRFPSTGEMSAIPRSLWVVPGSDGLRYHYVAGLRAGHTDEILVYEPMVDPDERLTLRINGDILSVPAHTLPLPASGAKP
jgi:hypothetical protein